MNSQSLFPNRLGVVLGGILFTATVLGGACQKPENQIIVVPTMNGTGGSSDGTGGAPAEGTGGEQGSGGADGTGGVPAGSGGASVDAAADADGGSGGNNDAAIVDLAPSVDTPPPPVDAAPETPLPPLQECGTPSIDRLQHWMVASEANAVTMPAIGASILMTEGDHQIGQVTFVGGGWHIVSVWTTNSNTSQADLSGSAGFTLTYSATANFYVQLRETANYANGGHFVVQVPSTGGQTQSVFISFAASNWTTLPALGNPTVTFDQAITQVRGLFMIGNAANTLVFRGLRIDGFTPQCM